MLCLECRKKYDAWLSAPMSRSGIRIANGAAYDDTLPGLLDKRRARADAHWKLVRQQTQAIKQICEKKHAQAN